MPACLLSEVGQAACSYACYKFEIWNTLFQTCYKFEIWNSNLFSIQTFFVRMCKREQRKSQPCCKIVALGSLRGCRGVCLWFAGFYGYDGICVWAKARHMNFSCPRPPSCIWIRARHMNPQLQAYDICSWYKQFACCVWLICLVGSQAHMIMVQPAYGTTCVWFA